MSIATALARKDFAINHLLCLGIREGGIYEYLEAMRGGISGSREPNPQAVSALPGFDPGRKVNRHG